MNNSTSESINGRGETTREEVVKGKRICRKMMDGGKTRKIIVSAPARLLLWRAEPGERRNGGYKRGSRRKARRADFFHSMTSLFVLQYDSTKSKSVVSMSCCCCWFKFRFG